MEQNKPDWKKILDHFESGKSLTKLQCLVKFDCMHLAGRVYDLRKMGYDVQGRTIQLPSKKCVKRYFIPEFHGNLERF